MQAPPPDGVIFIDFAHADRDRVTPLVEAIEARGHPVWMDESVGSGVSWEREIERVIAAAACVVVVLTANSQDDPSLPVDAARAGVAGKLLPVRLDPVPLPVQLANVQALDLTDWDGQAKHPALSRLLAAIERVAGPPAQSPDDQGSHAQAAPPRTRRIRIPDIAWIEIPAGPFIWQDGEPRELPTFWMAKYPVTNAQYQCFIDDGGYADDRWWRDLKRPEPARPRWPQGNRPRTDVDWYEAVAFCRWLTARLGLPEDSIRLPTDLEWEKAARGEQGLAYPWGAEYRSGFANVDETDRYGIDQRKAGPWFLDQTTAVGVYPHGRSPYGVEDLAGTVWEWCLNKRDDVDAVAADTSGAARALRGGFWVSLPRLARADLRFWSRPDDRNVFGGVRLLSSVPIDADC
jgi:formylglycine-generating enzyme required for sulfatase activity